MRKFEDARVAAVFDAYPKATRAKLLALRKLIFDTAAKTEGVGELEETLKWGQPSYLTTATKSGSTIRIDAIKGDDTRYAAYFICHTNLVETFRELYRGELRVRGQSRHPARREEATAGRELSHCIALALTYQLAKRRERGERAPVSSRRNRRAVIRPPDPCRSAMRRRPSPTAALLLRTSDGPATRAAVSRW